MMLICARNGEYWRFADRLLRGVVPDDEQSQPRIGGLTLEAAQQDLAAAGLTVCDVTTREPDGDDAARFAASLALGLEALGIDPRDYAKRATPSHLIWRVRREPYRRMVLSGNMLNPVGGVSHVRVVYPIQAIATDPTVFANVTDRVEVGLADDGRSRIFVLHRPALLGEAGHALLRGLTEAGFLIVTEFDDLPDHFDMMRMGGDLGFRGVHALQTSTTAMAAAIRQYNPEIAVFPNAVCRLPEIRNFADPNAITVFFGALNREKDWLPIMPAINAVAAMAGQRLRFEVVHDQAFFDALDTPHKNFTPTCDYETYLRILGGSEISLMPLSDTPFNRAKSDLKFIEAGSCRVVALASTVVYGNSIEEGRTGLLFRDPVEFHARLLHLLAMPELARDMADAARRYVADERMLAYQVAPRIAWYRSLWARRDALSHARNQRMLRYRTAA
jgi:glycosyltransferase involved in cell wall biosynthesis